MLVPHRRHRFHVCPLPEAPRAPPHASLWPVLRRGPSRLPVGTRRLARCRGPTRMPAHLASRRDPPRVITDRCAATGAGEGEDELKKY
jgi:hypothetical protein